MFFSEKKFPSDIGHKQIRLTARVTFLNQDRKSLSRPYISIIDTGAPVSVIPHSIWQHLFVQKIGELPLMGVNRKEECQIPCDVGIVLMRFLEKGKKLSVGLKPLAYLVPENVEQVPLILGYERCLEYYKLEADIPKKTAFLIPSTS